MEYKFKLGDRVRCIPQRQTTVAHSVGAEFTIRTKGCNYRGKANCWSDQNWYADAKTDSRYCSYEDALELIEEQYTKLTPKVGDRFRVIKKMEGVNYRAGDIILKDKAVGCWTLDNKSLFQGMTRSERHLTTEYLEPIEEEVISGVYGNCTYTDTSGDKRRIEIPDGYFEPIPEKYHNLLADFSALSYLKNNNKQTIMTIPKAIKKLLSKDLQKFYKTERINNELELTTSGSREYVQALFNNKGDHKVAVAEMVTNAEEEIEEAKED